jgi:alkylhydroperoxidase/carboxymuconolactone decarboxylase family protein YurZ
MPLLAIRDGLHLHEHPIHGRTSTMSDSEEVLRRLTIGEREFCRTLVTADLQASPHGLDDRSQALLRLGATMMAGSSTPMWQQRVSDALENGLDFDDIVEALTTLAPTLGIDRVVAIAPELARALGYDIDAALERLET